MEINDCTPEITKTLMLAILLFEWWLGRQQLIVPKSTLSLAAAIVVGLFCLLGELLKKTVQTILRRITNG
jgi:hypothetical protein